MTTSDIRTSTAACMSSPQRKPVDGPNTIHVYEAREPEGEPEVAPPATQATAGSDAGSAAGSDHPVSQTL